MKKINKYILFLTIILSPLYLVKTTLFHLPTNLHEILMLFYIFLSAFSVKKENVFRIFNKNRIFWIGIFFLITGLIISMVFNNTYTASLGIIKGWFIIPIFFSLACINSIKNRRDIDAIFISLFLSISLISLISLIAFMVGLRTYDGRLQGFYNSPNYLAMFLAPGVFIWFFMRQEKQLTLYGKFALDFCFVPIIICIYLTYSYGSWIGILMSLILVIPMTKKYSSKRFFLFSTLALFLFFIIFQFNTEKFLSLTHVTERSSIASRLIIWRSAEKILSDNISLGIGSGNFQYKYLEYQKFFSPYLEWAVPHPHNLFLSTWLQSGIIGLLGFALINYWVFRNIFPVKKNSHPEMAFFGILTCYYCYIFIHGLIDTTYWKNDLSLVFWLYTFLLIKIREEKLP